MHSWQKSYYERMNERQQGVEFAWGSALAIAPLVLVYLALLAFTDGEARWLDVVRRGELYLVALVIALSSIRGAWAARSGIVLALLVALVIAMVVLWSDLLANTVVNPDPARAGSLEARAVAGIWWVVGSVFLGSLTYTKVSGYGRW